MQIPGVDLERSLAQLDHQHSRRTIDRNRHQDNATRRLMRRMGIVALAPKLVFYDLGAKPPRMPRPIFLTVRSRTARREEPRNPPAESPHSLNHGPCPRQVFSPLPRSLRAVARSSRTTGPLRRPSSSATTPRPSSTSGRACASSPRPASSPPPAPASQASRMTRRIRSLAIEWTGPDSTS